MISKTEIESFSTEKLKLWLKIIEALGIDVKAKILFGIDLRAKELLQTLRKQVEKEWLKRIDFAKANAKRESNTYRK